MRKIFPQDAARRAFLKSVGASTALAALSQFFPLKTATEVFAQGGALEKKDLKVGFIPITCATPIIMAQPMGFYTKHGLNVEVIKTAGWAVIRDKTLNKEYDAAHMLSPMPLAITLGVGSNPVPYTVPAIENINGQAITLSDQAQGQARSEVLEGLQVRGAVRLLDAQLPAALLPRRARPRSRQDVQIRAVPPPEMVANLRADNIDGFLGPDPMNQRAVFDGVGFIHMLSKEIWDGHPCCAFAASQGVRHRGAEHLRGAAQVDHRCDRVRQQGGEPQADRRGDRAGELHQPAGDGARADADRHVRRRPRQREAAMPNRVDFDPFP